MSAIQFYKETEFKEVELNGRAIEIPEDWEVVELDKIVEIHDNKRIPLSERERAKRKGPYPYCGATGIIDYIDDYIFEGEYVLLAEDGGYYGPFEPSAYIMTGKFWVNNHAHVLKAVENVSDNWFIMYMLNYLDLRPYIVGSTRTKLNQEYMRKIRILLPPLEEQKKIAHVLRTIDNAIEIVEKAIEKLERIKKATMEQLLTKGIGHKEFKKVKLDCRTIEIPKDWIVVRLKDITLPTESIDPTRTPNKEFKYVDITNVSNTMYKIIGWNLINGKNAPSRARRLIRSGDIIFATTRPYLKNIAIVPDELDNQICSTGFCVIRANRNKVIPEWIFYCVLTDDFIARVSSKMRGATYPAVSDKDVLNEKIPLPPLEEQKQIVKILKTIDEAIELKKKKKEKLERMKKAVMDKLLTGQIRIK